MKVTNVQTSILEASLKQVLLSGNISIQKLVMLLRLFTLMES